MWSDRANERTGTGVASPPPASTSPTRSSAFRARGNPAYTEVCSTSARSSSAVMSCCRAASRWTRSCGSAPPSAVRTATVAISRSRHESRWSASGRLNAPSINQRYICGAWTRNVASVCSGSRPVSSRNVREPRSWVTVMVALSLSGGGESTGSSTRPGIDQRSAAVTRWHRRYDPQQVCASAGGPSAGRRRCGPIRVRTVLRFTERRGRRYVIRPGRPTAEGPATPWRVGRRTPEKLPARWRCAVPFAALRRVEETTDARCPA